MSITTLETPRPLPWGGVGVDTEGLMTAEECIATARLDWEVEKVPSGGWIDGAWVFDGRHDDEGGFHGSWKTTIPAHDGEPAIFLGDVGDIYEPLQNRAAFEFADSLVDSGDAKYVSAGALRGGRVVFLAMKFPREILIAGVDPVDLYGVLWNSHDGTKAITCMATPIMPRCMNTLRLGLARARATWSVKHIGTLEGRLAEARESLRLSFQYGEAWKQAMDELAQAQFGDSQFEELVEQATGGSTRLGEKWVEGLLESWESGPRRGMHNRSTKWDALSAVTEYADWLREPRTDMSRFEATMFGGSARLRERAYHILLDQSVPDEDLEEVSA